MLKTLLYSILPPPIENEKNILTYFLLYINIFCYLCKPKKGLEALTEPHLLMVSGLSLTL